MKKDIFQSSLSAHRQWAGKLEVVPTVPINNLEDLSLVYTPGVAEPCREIVRNPDAVYQLTTKNNSVAVDQDGTAGLGLGNI